MTDVQVDEDKKIWEKIIEDARYYPSPHNSQPIKINLIDSKTADIYYDTKLGLPAESYGIPFAHVCAGVFLESLRIVAAQNGYLTNESLFLDDLNFESKEHLHKFARIILSPTDNSTEITEDYTAFMRRRTSRLPYDASIISSDIIKGAKYIAAKHGYNFVSTTNRKTVNHIVRVNQSTLFDDLRNDAVYNELMLWLRFSKKQAKKMQDGLSAETMIMPGRILHFLMKHRNAWSYPIIGAIIRSVYLRTMRGVRQLGWLEGSFKSTADYIEAGRTFMKVWIFFTKHNIRLHPFGTVITNQNSHKEFVLSANISETDDSMAWMLFRLGHSKTPPKAYRRPAEVMLIKKGTNGQNQ